MLGTTHITAGIAASLLLIRPKTPLEFFTAAAGGALGGVICDIDCKHSGINKEAVKGAVLGAATVALALLFDYYIGNGIFDYLSKNLGITTIAGIVGFLVCCIGGVVTKHRTFTHSLLGILGMSASAYLICQPFGIAVLWGMCSHVFLDLFNEKGIQILFPLKRPSVCFGVCSSNGKVNSILTILFSLLCTALIPYFACTAIRSLQLSDILNGTGLSGFVVYLIVINIITFVAYCIDFFVCSNIGIELDQNYWHTFLSFLAIIGGAYGMLLSMLFLGQMIEKCNVNMWLMSISLSLFWTMVCFVIFNPLHIAISFQSGFFAGALIYLIVINVLTAVFFILDLKKHHTKMNPAEMLLLFLFIGGGAITGLMIVTVTNKRKTSAMYAHGLPIMLAIQSAAVVFLIAYGNM